MKKALSDSAAALEKAEKDRKADAERIAKLEDEALTARLTARVQKDFANAPGTVEEKVATLKAIEGTKDEAVKKTLIASLNQAEELAKKMSVERGSGSAAEGSAEDKLNKAAEEIAKTEKVTFEVALRKVWDDPKFADLRKEATAGKR